MKPVCFAVACVACTSLASAQAARFEIAPMHESLFSVTSGLHGVENFLGSAANSVEGDTFGTGVTVFSNIAGGFLFDEPTTAHTFVTDPDPGALAFAGSLGVNFALQEGFLFTNASAGVAPDTFDITIQWVGLDPGSNFATIMPVGTNIDGDPVTSIAFEIGGPNVLNDVLESVDPSFSASEILFNNFILFDDTGAALFNNSINPAAFDLSSGGLQATPTIAAGGADLGDFAIAGGQLDLTIRFVPAPGTISMVAVFGMVTLRRRR